jgi:hypothetical protein
VSIKKFINSKNLKGVYSGGGNLRAKVLSNLAEICPEETLEPSFVGHSIYVFKLFFVEYCYIET